MEGEDSQQMPKPRVEADTGCKMGHVASEHWVVWAKASWGRGSVHRVYRGFCLSSGMGDARESCVGRDGACTPLRFWPRNSLGLLL